MSHFVIEQGKGSTSPVAACVPNGEQHEIEFIADGSALGATLTSRDDESDLADDSLRISLGPRVGTDEGRFTRIEIDPRSAGQITVEGDPLGMRPVFVARDPAQLVLTDSIHHALRDRARLTLDPIGFASFVTLGWPLGDRTLFSEWRVLEPGRHRFAEGVAVGFEPSLLDVVGANRRSVRAVARDLLHELSDFVAQRLSRDPQTLVQLTGGQDSRVILAACLAAGLRPHTITRGSPSDLEVRIAQEVAQRAGCTHTIVEDSHVGLADSWEEHARTLITRTDGMVSLWQLSDVLTTHSAARSLLGGIGGEIARRYWHQSATLDPNATRPQIIDALTNRLAKNHGGLLRPEIAAELRAAIHARARDLAERVDDPRDLPDLFYALERVRRWGGANARKIDARSSTLAILASRTFLRAALSITPQERVECALHAEIVRQAQPSLLRIPLLGSEWNVSRFAHFFRERAARRIGVGRSQSTSSIANDRSTHLTRWVADLAPRLLDSPRSRIFDLLDRRVFEAITDPATSPASQLRNDSVRQALCGAMTAFLALSQIGEEVPPRRDAEPRRNERPPRERVTGE